MGIESLALVLLSIPFHGLVPDSSRLGIADSVVNGRTSQNLLQTLIFRSGDLLLYLKYQTTGLGRIQEREHNWSTASLEC